MGLTKAEAPADVVVPCWMGAGCAHRRADWQCRICSCWVGYYAELIGETCPARRAALYDWGVSVLAGLEAGCDSAVGIVACSISKALRVDSAQARQESEDEFSPAVEDAHPELRTNGAEFPTAPKPTIEPPASY